MNLKPAYSALRNFAATLGVGLTDLMYPPHCLGCGIPLDRDVLMARQACPATGKFPSLLCETCNLELPYIEEHVCLACGHELAAYAAGRKRCHACSGKTLNFVSAAAPFRYDGIARSLILQFKLSRRHWLAPMLAEYLADRLRRTSFIGSIDAIVPVPVHWRRYVKRGYNQASLLALEIGRKFRLPVVDCLRRTVNTRTQTAVSGSARMENMQGVFAIRKAGAVKGKRILLIDDVITTCATCAECSRVLVRGGGARSVHVATIARTMLKP